VRRIVLVMVVVGSLAVPAGAQGTSLVFNRDDGNVWLSNADGTGLYQVTLDGDPTDPYGPPSQADNGMIVTSSGSGNTEELILLQQNGAVLNSFVPSPEYEGGIIDSDVSPDGTKIAYTTGFSGNATCDPGSVGFTPCVITFVVSSSGTNLGVTLADYREPTWISSTRLVTDDRSSLYTRDVPGSNVHWFGPDGGNGGTFSDPVDNPSDSDWRNGRLAAVTGGAGNRKYISFWDAPSAGSGGQPTTTPTLQSCQLTDPVESPPQPNDVFNDPSLSPDGTRLAWEETNHDDNVDGPGEGIWIWNMGAGTLATVCANIGTTLPTGVAIPFASNPDFGPANNNPGPRPSPPPPPPPPGGGGGTPSGGSTGGGSTGGQTTTQQQVVPPPPPPVTGSGAADRVVGSLTVGGLAITFMAPGTCVPAGQNANLAVTSQLKNNKKKRLKFKIKQVTFSFDSTKQVDKSAPFTAAFPTAGLASGSRHAVSAAMAIKKPGKKKLLTKTLRASIGIC
jgi:hypothetical protein